MSFDKMPEALRQLIRNDTIKELEAQLVAVKEQRDRAYMDIAEIAEKRASMIQARFRQHAQVIEDLGDHFEHAAPEIMKDESVVLYLLAPVEAKTYLPRDIPWTAMPSSLQQSIIVQLAHQMAEFLAQELNA